MTGVSLHREVLHSDRPTSRSHARSAVKTAFIATRPGLCRGQGGAAAQVKADQSIAIPATRNTAPAPMA